MSIAESVQPQSEAIARLERSGPKKAAFVGVINVCPAQSSSTVSGLASLRGDPQHLVGLVARDDHSAVHVERDAVGNGAGQVGVCLDIVVANRDHTRLAEALDDIERPVGGERHPVREGKRANRQRLSLAAAGRDRQNAAGDDIGILGT